MFKIAIGTQLLQTEVPCPLKPSEHYFCVKNKFTLFKPAVDPRGFQTEIQICPGPGWQHERQQQPSPQSFMQAPTAAGREEPRAMLRATARVLLSPVAHNKDMRFPAAQPCWGSCPAQDRPHTNQPPIPTDARAAQSTQRLFLNSLTATYFVIPNTCCIRKLLLLQALK